LLAYHERNLSTEEKGKIADKALQRRTSAEKERLSISLPLSAQTLKSRAENNWRANLFSNCRSQIRHRGDLLAEQTFKKSGQTRVSLSISKKFFLLLLYVNCILRRKFLYYSCVLVKKNATLICLIPLAILPSERLLSYTTELCRSYGDGHVVWILPCKLKKNGRVK